MGKITIIKNGPYHVEGVSNLIEEHMVQIRSHIDLKKIADIENEGEYRLCRCGQSKNMPFCDGTHLQEGPDGKIFDGKELADKSPYLERVDRTSGPEVTILDDGRCSFARMCHFDGTEVWTLAMNSNDPDCKDLSIKRASECPTGRLTAMVDGEMIENEYQETISICEDPTLGISGPILVRGGVELVGEDGESYEIRNRYALCRCGKSADMPFCDATHVDFRLKYKDL